MQAMMPDTRCQEERGNRFADTAMSQTSLHFSGC
jgi:hypothetical protein